MKAIFRMLHEGQDVEVGELLVKDGHVVAAPAGSEMMAEIAGEVNGEIDRLRDVERVMRFLPKYYRSAYLRAEVIEDSPPQLPDHVSLEVGNGAEFGWVTKEGGQHIFINDDGSVSPSGHKHGSEVKRLDVGEVSRAKFRLSSVGEDVVPSHWSYGDDSELEPNKGFQVWDDLAQSISALAGDPAIDGSYTPNEGYDKFQIVLADKYTSHAGGNFWSSTDVSKVKKMGSVSVEDLLEHIKKASGSWDENEGWDHKSLKKWIGNNESSVHKWLADNAKEVKPKDEKTFSMLNAGADPDFVAFAFERGHRVTSGERKSLAKIGPKQIQDAIKLWKKAVPKEKRDKLAELSRKRRQKAEFGWVTKDGGQHIYINDDGSVSHSGPSKEQIGTGSTGAVYKVGEHAVKKATAIESEVYSHLSGLPGIAEGKTVGDEIHVAYYKNVISVDTTTDKRRSLGGILARNEERINLAVSALSSRGYDYNDPLQFGLGKDQKLDLLDFSNVAKVDRFDAALSNMSHLSSFYKTFGNDKASKAVGAASDFLSEIQTSRYFGSDSSQGKYKDAAEEIASSYPEGMLNVYYSTNAREVGINGADQTAKIDGIKLLVSKSPISKEDIAKWELVPILVTNKEDGK